MKTASNRRQVSKRKNCGSKARSRQFCHSPPQSGSQYIHPPSAVSNTRLPARTEVATTSHCVASADYVAGFHSRHLAALPTNRCLNAPSCGRSHGSDVTKFTGTMPNTLPALMVFPPDKRKTIQARKRGKPHSSHACIFRYNENLSLG